MSSPSTPPRDSGEAGGRREKEGIHFRRNSFQPFVVRAVGSFNLRGYIGRRERDSDYVIMS